MSSYKEPTDEQLIKKIADRLKRLNPRSVSTANLERIVNEEFGERARPDDLNRKVLGLFMKKRRR